LKHIIEYLERHILSGCTGNSERLIGTEIETFYYNNKGLRISADRGQEYSSTDLITAIENYFSNEGSHVTCSLEPGGQVEWASKPTTNLHVMQQELDMVQRAVHNECEENDLSMVDLSVEPIHSPDSIKLIGQNKYHLMDARFQKSGNHGQWMMRNTTSVQVNIDMINKQDAEESIFIADCINPIASIIFSNAPFMNSHPIGYKNLRYRIWSDTDLPRCGHLLEHGIHGIKGAIDNYCKHVVTVPVIFTTPDEKGITRHFDGSIGDWLNTQIKDEVLDPHHLKTALHQIFTHVRYKKLLEIRSADRPPQGYELAPVVFWTALMERGEIRKKILDQLTNWTHEDRQKLITQASRLDLDQIGPMSCKIVRWVEWLVDVINDALVERSERLQIESEAKLFMPFIDSVLSRGIFTLQTQENFAQTKMTVKDFIMKRTNNV